MSYQSYIIIVISYTTYRLVVPGVMEVVIKHMFTLIIIIMVMVMVMDMVMDMDTTIIIRILTSLCVIIVLVPDIKCTLI